MAEGFTKRSVIAGLFIVFCKETLGLSYIGKGTSCSSFLFVTLFL